MAKKVKTLILCVDRDDDVGRKTSYKGPIVGRETNLKMATALALADPQDSDANTVFAAVRTYDTLKKDGENVDVATVTGHQDVGVRSDKRIAEQLEKVFSRTKAEKVILVTDGIEDEHVIPLIQSHGDLVAVNRVVIKQSERLEGMYYMMHDFVENPKMSKIFLGLPALALLLLAFFGTAGWRLILGGLGLYLLVKGFQLESRVATVFAELSTSFKTRRITFFFYIASIFIGFVGLKSGYDFIRLVGTTTTIETAAAFIHGSVFMLFAGFAVALLGKLLSVLHSRRETVKYITYGAIGLGISLVGFEAANVILAPEGGLLGLFAALLFGLFVVAVSRAIERLV